MPARPWSACLGRLTGAGEVAHPRAGGLQIGHVDLVKVRRTLGQVPLVVGLRGVELALKDLAIGLGFDAGVHVWTTWANVIVPEQPDGGEPSTAKDCHNNDRDERGLRTAAR